MYRNGITAGPVIELDRSRDRLLNAAGINQSRLAYQLTLPLRRNRGQEVVAAQEISAGVQVEASQLDLTQTFTDLLTNTAVSYWDLVGAIRLLEVAISSEQLFPDQHIGKIAVHLPQERIPNSRESLEQA